MPRDGRPPEIHCTDGFMYVFSLLGKRWTGPIVAVLLQRPARFAELARAIPGITEPMLSARLAELKKADLVARELIEGPPIGAVYRLTPRGDALRPALLALGRWANGATSAGKLGPVRIQLPPARRARAASRSRVRTTG